jgi:nitroimidazol reductase NimA-like FMN-containing flavoprotein (pyridoxamine 5'-phosphate oxidase superfamily)
MRRKDREIGRAEAEEVLAKGVYGVLSINGAEGPYGVPVCHALLRGAIYFHCAMRGRKSDLLKDDDRVSFCVVGETETMPSAFSMKYRSAIVSGRVAEVTDNAEKLEVLDALVLKYSGPEYAAAGRTKAEAALAVTAIYAIKPDAITGKARV